MTPLCFRRRWRSVTEAGLRGLAAVPALVVLLAALLLVALLATLLGTTSCRGPTRRVPAEQAVLERRCQELDTLINAAGRGPLLAHTQVLVAVDQGLVQELLSSAIPYERVVAGRYRIRITGAAVEFDDGFALVRLDGRASFASGPEAGAYAEVIVYGGLDILDVDPASGTLRGRMRIIAVDAREVGVLGVHAPAKRLVEELGREKLDAFSAIASALEIPVRVDRQLAIPALGPEGPVSIAAVALPVSVSLVDVESFRGRLWVAINASLRHAPGPSQEPRHSAHTPEGSPPAMPRTLGDLRTLHRRLHERLEERVAADPLLVEAEAQKGHVVLAIRTSLLTEIMQEVGSRYLERVVLDLVPDIRLREAGEVKARTLLGTIKAGDWSVVLAVLRIHGVLRARSPRVEFDGTNRVRLSLPVLLEEGHGTVGVHFKWDATSVANILCRDFELDERLEGLVAPQQYQVVGAFLLDADGESLLARPQFPETPFHIRPDLTPASWQAVRRDIESQDSLLKCGIGVRTADVLPRLEELVRRGFDVKLPRSLFRAVRLPASLRGSVAVEDRRVDLSVRPSALRLTADSLWYGAEVHSQVRRTR